MKVPIKLDTKPCIAEVSEDLKALLAKTPKAKATFKKLPPSQKKVYAGWIMEAKTSQTHEKHVEEALSRLSKG